MNFARILTNRWIKSLSKVSPVLRRQGTPLPQSLPFRSEIMTILIVFQFSPFCQMMFFLNLSAFRRCTGISLMGSLHIFQGFLPSFRKLGSAFSHAGQKKIIPDENKKYIAAIFNILVGNKKYIVDNNWKQPNVGKCGAQLAEAWRGAWGNRAGNAGE